MKNKGEVWQLKDGI